MSSNLVNQAVERIQNIDWSNYNDSRTGSHVALMREYLRRTALWAKALNVTGTGAFFDVALCIVPEVRAPQHLIEEMKSKLPNLWGRVESTCIWYVHWQAAKEHPEMRKFDLPEPYEPLIRMYERGGDLTTEHGFINVGSAGIYFKSWDDFVSLESLPDLADDTLDRIDAQAAKPELVAS